MQCTVVVIFSLFSQGLQTCATTDWSEMALICGDAEQRGGLAGCDPPDRARIVNSREPLKILQSWEKTRSFCRRAVAATSAMSVRPTKALACSHRARWPLTYQLRAPQALALTSRKSRIRYNPKCIK